MKIVDLTEEFCHSYFVCLEDWSEEIKEAGNHKALWYSRMKDRGLRVKLAMDDEKACGMIQCLPIEESVAQGNGLYFIQCIWVHGHKKGVGNYQKRGFGTALLQAAEDDAKSRGANGMAAWGVSLPFWMKASWFKKHGYKKVDKESIQVLLWKPFTDDARPPTWIREKKKPETMRGKVTVTAFMNGWCPAMNMVYERAKRAAQEIGDKVVFQEVHTFNRDVFLEWGISDALFIDGKQMRTGPPPPYERIKRKIAKRVKKID